MQPDISVIVPTHNRRKDLEICLGSLFKQDYPYDRYEIIVVNDGSKDDTEAFVIALQKLHNNLVYLKQENRGAAAARNRGAENASSNILAYIDDDCIADDHWLSEILRVFKEFPDDVVMMGGLQNHSEKNIYGVVWEFVVDKSISRDLQMDGQQERFERPG